MKTQDSFLVRYDSSLLKIESEFTRLYGTRYLEYRKHYKEAGGYAFQPDFPLYVMLEQSFRCNLSCPSCIHGYKDEERRFITKSTIMERNLFEQVVLECQSNNCPSISFHANDEPFLVPDLVDRIRFAKEHGFMDLIMTTNGNLLAPDMVEPLVSSGITKILFSIDAATDDTYAKVRPGGTFKKVYEAVRSLYEYKQKRNLIFPAIRASFVVSKLNMHEMRLFADTFSPLVDYIEFQGFYAYYNITSYLVPDGAQRIKKFNCVEPWRKLIVRANGDVLPCCSFYGYELILGNIKQDTLRSIFNSDACQQLKADFKNGIYRNRVCKACSSSNYEFSIVH